jgi:hypothetical protein
VQPANYPGSAPLSTGGSAVYSGVVGDTPAMPARI